MRETSQIHSAGFQSNTPRTCRNTPTLVLGLFMLGNDNLRYRNGRHVKFQPQKVDCRVVEDYFLGTNGQLFIANAYQLHRGARNDKGRRSTRFIATNCNFTNKLSLTKFVSRPLCNLEPAPTHHAPRQVRKSVEKKARASLEPNDAQDG